MTPYLLALTANFFWASVNIVDKYLVERFCSEGSIGSLLILSSLFPVTLLPIAYIFSGQNVLIAHNQILILLLSGILTTSWMYFYFKALFDDNVTTVVPLLQLSPVFSLFFGFIILNEIPTSMQLLAGALIVIGSVVLSFEGVSGKLKLKLFSFMLAAAAIIALMNALFKYVALDENFWVSIFWHALGTFISGVFILCISANYRNSFLSFMKINWGTGLRMNGFNETLTIIGDVLFAYAILLAPLALVHTMEGFQPLIVLLLTYILIKLNVSYFTDTDEDTKTPIFQLLSGIIFIVIGSILLATTSI